MICRHCGKVSATQSVEGALALMNRLGVDTDFRIEEAHKGGFLVFANYDDPCVGEFPNRSLALQFIWDQLGNPAEYA